MCRASRSANDQKLSVTQPTRAIARKIAASAPMILAIAMTSGHLFGAEREPVKNRGCVYLTYHP